MPLRAACEQPRLRQDVGLLKPADAPNGICAETMRLGHSVGALFRSFHCVPANRQLCWLKGLGFSGARVYL